jgi:hypothetical protein
MTREENFEQFVTRKYALFDNLRGNHHPVEHEDLTNAVIDYLPVALSGSLALLSLWCLGTPGIRSTTSLS